MYMKLCMYIMYVVTVSCEYVMFIKIHTGAQKPFKLIYKMFNWDGFIKAVAMWIISVS